MSGVRSAEVLTIVLTSTGSSGVDWPEAVARPTGNDPTRNLCRFVKGQAVATEFPGRQRPRRA